MASDPTPQLEAPAAPASPAPADFLPDIQKIIQLCADVFQENAAAVTKDLEDPAIAALAADALVYVVKNGKTLISGWMAGKLSALS